MQGAITQLSEQISRLNERMDELTSRIEQLNSNCSIRRVSTSQQNLALQSEVCNVIVLRVHEHKRGGELCWPIFSSFWKHPQEQFGQSVCSDPETE